MERGHGARTFLSAIDNGVGEPHPLIRYSRGLENPRSKKISLRTLRLECAATFQPGFLLPSFSMRERSVLGLIPSISAAPPLP